ncbi:hypothetical protein COT70_01140 [candidate division WWE3 bacterium CG09_land_8_20_14_0_10_47_33]|uniref:Type II secretion system protein GspG C-terminal domain-containing protein n=1 Tax=candidate division WWE3 bacterium CG_4_9_14_0_2_um_filter_48_10 TaxID=1975078 RepID=A0A2M8EIQ5_UNCKA|nr:MAG: hypothetical protein COT70_01140 [candidate division WWE3 bacterium CG09_land_8_20_14_0_10_47_33]PJC22599.1 MAG: hypothetical protein CO059_02165 [candidate division WWE3 bacterium CG_4_9_14_0_2_um_filter_48_10]PJE52361.1 MAG: hypothetical protein COV28_00005 [candidate division WWE3 bacterium CG10_big_fil_rev_8_21_14_0_10_48_23]
MPIIKRQITVAELLIALALILILAAVGSWALNPIERLKQGRDNQRISDLENLRKAVDLAISEGVPLTKTMGVPASSVSVGVTQAVDGTGWVGMNLSKQINTLPIDPSNSKTFIDVLSNAVTGEYQFISDGIYYVLRTHLEAEANKDYYSKDGNDNSWYEIGTAPGLSTYFGL